MNPRPPKSRRKPVVQAIGASPISGTVPPVEYRFRPGQSGNPAGRKTAGAFLQDWINAMADWSVERLDAVLSDKDAPASKVAAARLWKDAASNDRNAAGSPIAGAEFDRIMDRTIGKPTQSVGLETPAGGLTFALIVAKPDA